MTEPGVPYTQGYELSMGIAVRIIHLLGGPEAGYEARSRSRMPSRVPTRLTAMRWAARSASGSRGAGSSCRLRWPRDASRTRTRRPGASRRNTLRPSIFRQRDAVGPGGRADPPVAADRPLQRRRHRRRTRDAPADPAAATGGRGYAVPGHHRPRASRSGRALLRRAGPATQPDRRPARVCRTERAQSVVPTLVRPDTPPVSGGRGEIVARMAVTSATSAPPRAGMKGRRIVISLF